MIQACRAGPVVRTGGAASARSWRRPAGHWHRTVSGAAALALAAVLTGCASLAAGLSTGAALQRAGYQQVGVNVANGNDLPAGGVVQVSYSRGPAGDDLANAHRAERIVWDNFAARFGAVTIMKVSGGCAGPACFSRSRQIASATYSELRSAFGPRPRGLRSTLWSAFGVQPWRIALVVILLLAVIVVAIVILRRYRRPSAPPLTFSPGPAGPGSQPHQPGQH